MFTHVGHVFYNAGSSSPIVLGDFAAMKRWPGSPDGPDGFVKFKSEQGAIFDLQLSSPDVFVEGSQRLVLLAPLRRTGWTIVERFGVALSDLQAAMTASLASTWYDDELKLPSGAVVVAISYNATPEVGADVSNIDPDRLGVPRLPVEAPVSPQYAADGEPPGAQEIAIVPLDPGRYRIRVGDISVADAPVGRCTLDWVGPLSA